MNVTHDEILALIVMKDRKIIALEQQLALARAEAETHQRRVEELEKLCLSQETSPTPSSRP